MVGGTTFYLYLFRYVGRYTYFFTQYIVPRYQHNIESIYIFISLLIHEPLRFPFFFPSKKENGSSLYKKNSRVDLA